MMMKEDTDREQASEANRQRRLKAIRDVQESERAHGAVAAAIQITNRERSIAEATAARRAERAKQSVGVADGRR